MRADGAAVFLGGVLGTAARLWLEAALAAAGEVAAFAAALCANLLGSFALGFLRETRLPARLELLRPAAGTGFCGAFTTFSAVALAVAAPAGAGPWAWLLPAAGIAAGVPLAGAGRRLARRGPAAGGAS